jgi:DNA mismatch repair protein MutS
MLDQFFHWKERYPDCLLLFRMGDFYETFFDDAKEAASLLDIALTARDPERAIPMAGVPFHAVESYLARLVAAGRRVAICEQLTEPDGRTLVERAVVRVVTPGTYLPEDSREGGRLAALAREGDRILLATLSASSGILRAGLLPPREAADLLAAFDPREILIPRGARGELSEWIDGVAPEAIRVERDPAEFAPRPQRTWIERRFDIAHISALGFEGDDPPLGAAAAALRYLEETQFAAAAHVLPPEPLRPQGRLFLDRSTQRHLDLAEGQGPTLLSTLDRCATPMGRGRLRSWVLEPLTDLEAISARQDAIGRLLDLSRIRVRLRESLGGCRDVERALGRLCLKVGTPRDLAAVRDTLRRLPEIRSLGEEARLGSFAILPDLTDLGDRLARGLGDAPPRLLRDGGTIRPGFDAELDDLRNLRDHADEELHRFEERERERTGIRTLKVGYNRVFGYYIEIGKGAADRAPEEYQRRQTLANAERYVHPELKAFEERILDAGERIGAREAELYQELLREVLERRREIQAAGRTLSELDALLGLAAVAAERRYVRPTVDRGFRLELRGARHPVVEASMSQVAFVPNDLLLDAEGEDRVAILTGPNMAGKSTILRTAALLQILAQAGSFLPVESARIGVCDRVFSRIGARDELARGRSTFLVEMLETANILRNLTDRSLVVLDEVGRGTSTYDGMSIAWAVVEHLQASPKRPRVLFATHYHELARLAERLPGVVNWSLEVREEADRIVFLHRLVSRAADRSYGIDVARLAGVPEPVLRRSRELLARFEAGRGGAAGIPEDMIRGGRIGDDDAGRGGSADFPPGGGEFLRGGVRGENPSRGRQLALFDASADAVLEELAILEPEQMTPLEALERIFALRERALEVRGGRERRG